MDLTSRVNVPRRHLRLDENILISKEEIDDTRKAASNLRKILAGEPGISTGVLGGSGAKSTQVAVDSVVPDGYVAVVDTETREFTRLPQRAFAQSVVQSDMGKGQKASMLRKAEKKDKEVFTSNKKMLKSVKQDKVKKKRKGNKMSY